MKLSLGLLMVLFLALGAIACSSSPDVQQQSQSNKDNNFALSKVALEVPTIWCSSCQIRVEVSAKSIAGVGDVKFDNQTVIVTYDPAQTSPESIVEAIERGGDRVTKVTKL